MISRFLHSPLLFISVLLLVLLSILATVQPTSFPFPFSRFGNYAIHLMVFFLLAGVASLLIRQPRLTFIFFGASAVICLFLKNSNNSQGINPWRRQAEQRIVPDSIPSVEKQTFRVVHINLKNVQNYDSLLSAINQQDIQVISVHEMDPFWEDYLTTRLSGTFPYQRTYADIGLFGMGLFSKYRMSNADTFVVGNVPALRATVNINGRDVHLLSFHTEPLVQESVRKLLIKQLDTLSDMIVSDQHPCILFSEMNLVSWSTQLQEFCRVTRLHESRRGFMQYISKSLQFLIETPFDHIFYTDPFRVVQFDNFLEPGSFHRIGIVGAYQIADNLIYAQ